MTLITITGEKMGENVVFFIGAGFTKAVVKTAPTGAQFLTKAFDPSGPFIKDKKVTDLKTFIEKIYYQLNDKVYPNIEDVLSLIDYSIQRKESLSRDYLLEDLIKVRNDFIYLIGKVIKECIEKSDDKDKTLKPSRDFIENISKLLSNGSYSKVSIISTNYDLIIDNALLEKKKSCNYAIRLRDSIFWDQNEKRENVRVNSAHGNWRFQNNEGGINEGDILLVKIHGSLNWFYCPKCDEIDITVGRKGATQLARDHQKFICINRFCTSNYEPLIVTPTMLKVYDNSFLKELWGKSGKMISETDKLIFIGYFLHPADYHIRSLITKSLVKNGKNPDVLVIDQKPEDKEVKKRYQALFGKNKVNFQPIELEGLLNDWNKFF